MNDALEILNEIEILLNDIAWYSSDGMFNALNNYIQQKRLEFVAPQGDCCG